MALKHSVYDSDTHFSINPISRAIKNESTTKTGLIQYDHNSERFTFEMPKVIEGHDMSQCDIVEVHYINIDAKTQVESKGVYIVEDLKVSAEDSNILMFSWLISKYATQYVGSLNFLVRFACIDESGNVLYVWNTAVHTGISVSNGIFNSEFVVEEFADVLSKWRSELQAFRLLDLQQTQESTESGGENIWTATFEGLEPKQFTVRNGQQGGPGPAGKSAYDVAKENGYEGTAEDWVNENIYPKFYKEGTLVKKITFSISGDTLSINTET